MPYFSRLTDIVTCNLTSILAKAQNPQVALEEIILEMQEGVAGAQRSASTASDNVVRVETEIAEQRGLVANWNQAAKQALSMHDEAQARVALGRKHELEDLIAGLEQQLTAAISTRDHLRTTLYALEARLADARRRRSTGDLTPEAAGPVGAGLSTAIERHSRVNLELEELRRQLEQ